MAQDENEQAKPPRDLKKILGMVYIALNLASMGAGSYMVYVSTVGYELPSAKSDELDRQLASFRKTLQEKPMMYSMEPINTNLSGFPRRLARVEINLEMLDAEGFEEIIDLGARGRDALVRLINGKSYGDLESVQGKLHLKNEIVSQLNGLLDRGVVKNVYFSDFVVQ